MYLKQKTVLIISLLTVLLTSCQSTQKPSKVNLKIIQTTDIHGAFFPYDFIKMQETNNSLAHVASFVNQVRKENPESTILLDNGDFFQGQPTSYYYNFEDTNRINLGADMLNYLKYDAITVGNHDIECGHNVYDKLKKELNADWLGANIIDVKTNEPYFKPYTVIERKGLRIAILGLITPGIPSWLPKHLWEGMCFDDMIVSAKKWMPIIKNKEKPDLIIGMFHSGVDYTYGNQNKETYKNENATVLVAEQVAGFDIILAGHDHEKHNFTVVNTEGDTVYIIDPLSHGRAVSYIDVNFEYNRNTKTYHKQIIPKIVSMEKYSSDNDFMKKFESEYNAIAKYVSDKIGELKTDISTKNAYFGSSSFIDFIHNAQIKHTNAQISFSAPLSFNIDVSAGDLYISDMFKLYKYENFLCVMKLSGKEIDSFLEYSASMWFSTMESENDNLLLLNDEKTQLKYKYFDFSSAAGINYTVDVTKPVGERINITEFTSGKKFYTDSLYNVVLNSYRANGGGGHLTKGAGIHQDSLQNRIIYMSEKDMRGILKTYIQQEKVLDLKPNNNWEIIPKNYCKRGRKKDFYLLFGDK